MVAKKNTKKNTGKSNKVDDEKVDDIVTAIKQIKLKKKKIRAMARAFAIPKTNLTRYSNELDKTIENYESVSDDILKQSIRRLLMRLPSNMVNFEFDFIFYNSFH